MTLDGLIRAFLATAEFDSGGPVPISGAPWIDAFEEAAGLRFPETVGELVTGHACPEIAADPIMARVTRARRMLRLARPGSGSYDPICFDLGRRPRAPIVRLDHEAILMSERIKVVGRIADSFEAFMRDIVA